MALYKHSLCKSFSSKTAFLHRVGNSGDCAHSHVVQVALTLFLLCVNIGLL
jgi:hypothetical protein